VEPCPDPGFLPVPQAPPAGGAAAAPQLLREQAPRASRAQDEHDAGKGGPARDTGPAALGLRRLLRQQRFEGFPEGVGDKLCAHGAEASGQPTRFCNTLLAAAAATAGGGELDHLGNGVPAAGIRTPRGPSPSSGTGFAARRGRPVRRGRGGRCRAAGDPRAPPGCRRSRPPSPAGPAARPARPPSRPRRRRRASEPARSRSASGRLGPGRSSSCRRRRRPAPAAAAPPRRGAAPSRRSGRSDRSAAPAPAGSRWRGRGRAATRRGGRGRDGTRSRQRPRRTAPGSRPRR
jgi:hypothetical protein